jgi:hypothetical protein
VPRAIEVTKRDTSTPASSRPCSVAGDLRAGVHPSYLPSSARMTRSSATCHAEPEVARLLLGHAGGARREPCRTAANADFRTDYVESIIHEPEDD